MSGGCSQQFVLCDYFYLATQEEEPLQPFYSRLLKFDTNDILEVQKIDTPERFGSEDSGGRSSTHRIHEIFAYIYQ